MQNAGSVVASSGVERLADDQDAASLVSNGLGAIDPNDASCSRPQGKERAAEGNERPGDFVRSANNSVRPGNRKPCRCRACAEEPKDVKLLVARDVHFAICHNGNKVRVSVSVFPGSGRRLIERCEG
jgi:hypothetical protein